MTLLVTADCIRLVDDETKVSKLLNELSGCVSEKFVLIVQYVLQGRDFLCHLKNINLYLLLGLSQMH